MNRLFSWRPRTFQNPILIWIVVVVVLVIFIIWGYWMPWTGFDGYKPDPNYEPEKKLWDWLDLLIIPVVLSLGAYYFNRAERRNELQIAQANRDNDLNIAERRAQDTLLQTYLDQMTELLLVGKLRDSKAGDEVRQVAQVRTLIALRRLDRQRRAILMQFLRASQLVGSDEARMIVDFHGMDLSNVDLSGTPIFSVSLQQANLRGADLRGAHLEGADLRGAHLEGAHLEEAILYYVNLYDANLAGANLRGADLYYANLEGANLRGADLEGANLRGADLAGADLQGAILYHADFAGANLNAARVTQEQLESAASLEGMVKPDGSKVTQTGVQ